MKKKAQKNNKNNQQHQKAKIEAERKKKQAEQITKIKQRYFDFYDDIKDYTRGKEDW